MTKISNLNNLLNNNLLYIKYLGISTFFLLAACEGSSEKFEKKESSPDSSSFENQISNEINERYDLSYFSGKAEVSTYNLGKARYNNIHPGESVLIFVTEPFLTKEQVKADNPSENNSVSVLKMNRLDRFTTGIYDYSIFTSVFTPTNKFDPTFPLKITMSSQDWCGLSFMQVNNKNGFDYMLRSYFESEGDTTTHLNYSYLEDNIFNIARIDTTLLPIGEFDIVPSMSYLRLAHIELKSYKAKGSLAILENQVVYVYDIPELKREVRIFMNPENHFQIVRWEETYPTVFDGKLRKSVYTLKSSRRIPYWELNESGDVHWRDSLKISSFDF